MPEFYVPQSFYFIQRRRLVTRKLFEMYTFDTPYQPYIRHFLWNKSFCFMIVIRISAMKNDLWHADLER